MIGPTLPMNRLVVIALCASVVLACGGEPPAKEPEPTREASHEVKLALKTRSELGTVDPGAVQTAFHKLELALTQLANLRTLQKSNGFQKGLNLVFWVLALGLIGYLIYLRLH